MGIKEHINQDLKAAMLAGDKDLVTTLRGLKSVLLYEEVAKGIREDGLPEADIIALLSKEAKKRQESADLYTQGGNEEKAQAELAEKKVIESYLPAQMSDEELSTLVDSVISEIGQSGPQAMGPVIAEVKKRSQGQADGGRIAKLVKEKLSS
jgi:uncharacterized protein YqeY